MNYEKNLQFIRYYVENVLLDMKPMIISLSKETIPIDRQYQVTTVFKNRYGDILKEETKQCVKTENVPKYDKNEIYKIFMKHINEIEYTNFCRILKIGWLDIYRWFTIDTYRDDYFERLLETNSEQYFRDQRRYLKKQQRKNKKLLI